MNNSSSEPAQAGETRRFSLASSVALSDTSDGRFDESCPGARELAGRAGCCFRMARYESVAGKVSRGGTPHNEAWRMAA